MSQPHPKTQTPHSFAAKKDRILKQLSIPSSEYDDLSPKGSIDVGIRDLIDEINTLEGFVTTSSCAGRVSVYLDGQKVVKGDGNEELREGDDGDRDGDREVKSGGGKGGGRWLFVSHDPVTVDVNEGECFNLFGLKAPRAMDDDEKALRKESSSSRLIHFKFEPMILHVLTSSLAHADLILSAALQSGFRESGALNLIGEPETPMVGIRSMGLALESIIGFESEGGRLTSLAPEWQLRHLVDVSNERFKGNEKRIERFRVLLKEMVASGGGVGGRKKGQEGDQWEDKDVRRERKMLEGKKRAEAVRREKEEMASSSRQDGVPNLADLGI